jgi:hypothetical protein
MRATRGDPSIQTRDRLVGVQEAAKEERAVERRSLLMQDDRGYTFIITLHQNFVLVVQAQPACWLLVLYLSLYVCVCVCVRVCGVEWRCILNSTENGTGQIQ